MALVPRCGRSPVRSSPSGLRATSLFSSSSSSPPSSFTLPSQRSLHMPVTRPSHQPAPTLSAKSPSPSTKESRTWSRTSHWMRKSPNSLTRPLRFLDSASRVTSGGPRHYTASPTSAKESIFTAPFLTPPASLKSSSPPPPSTNTSGTALAR